MNPTVALLTGVSALFYLDLGWAIAQPRLSASGTGGLFALQALLIYLLFTPLHDGVHRSASRNRRLNEAMLATLWLPFLNNPFLFRRIHIQHHTHVNGPLDP